jgi:anaphase-promoting complex subunit 2
MYVLYVFPRFGEESLHSCEIMIKDMEDSKRANNAVYSSLTNKAAAAAGQGIVDKDVDFVIISDNYWPSLTQDGMQLHPQLDQKLKRYSDEYSILKKPRKLNVLPQLGQVELTLDFEDGSSRDFVVSPLQANVIMFMAEATDGLSVQDLYYKLEVDEEEVAQAVKYWVQKKVLQESTTEGCADPVYFIVESQSGIESDDNNMDMSMDADKVRCFSCPHPACNCDVVNRGLEFLVLLLLGCEI